MESNTPSLPTIFILYSGAATETSSRIIVWPTTVPVRTSLLLAGRSRVKDQSPILPSKLYSGLGRAQTARSIIFGMRDLWNTRGGAGTLYSPLLSGKTRQTVPSFIMKNHFSSPWTTFSKLLKFDVVGSIWSRANDSRSIL